VEQRRKVDFPPSGSSASKKKKYHYADILSFLQPVAEKRK